MKKSLLALAVLSCIGFGASANATLPTCSGDCRGTQQAAGPIANGGISESNSDAYARAQQWQQQQQAQTQTLRNSGNGTGYGGEGGSAAIGAGAGSATLSGSFGGQGGSGTLNAQGALTGGAANGNQLTLAPGAIGGGNVYRSNDRAWAPIIHGPGAAPVATANMAVVAGICGARVEVVADDVIGQRFEQVGKDREFVQGKTERYVYAKEPFVTVKTPMGDFLVGHAVTTVVAALGTSSAGSFSLGLFGKNGEGAQGGAAGGNSHQQLVAKTVVQDCTFYAPPALVIPQPAIVPNVPTVKKGRE